MPLWKGLWYAKLPSDEAASESGAINLARLVPFRLGVLEVAPATRQIRRGARSETVEPRVMQVLVALRQAGGAVVTREDLILRCWDGRVVGDNAIHRTISRLRELAATIGENSFQIETVSKVGYRLLTCEPQAAVPTARPRHLLAGALAAILAVSIAVLGWTLYPAPSSPRVAVAGVSGAGAQQFAAGAVVDLAHLAAAHGNAVAFTAGPDGRSGSYLLEVATRVSGASTQADITFRRTPSLDFLWSASFVQRDGDMTALRQQVTNVASSTIDCALHAHGDPGRLSGEQLRTLLSACEILDDIADDARVAAWQRAYTQAPRNVAVLATLAYVEADLRDSNLFLLDRTGDAHSGAEEHIRAARASGEDPSLTYAAQALLVPASRFSERIAVIARGLARDPDCAILYGLKSQALTNVGRMEDALDSARRAAALDPDSPKARGDLISALAYDGFTQEARSVLNAALRIWPNSRVLQEVGFRFEFRNGDAAVLIRQIDLGKAFPNSGQNTQSGPVRSFLIARARPTRENIDASIAFSIRDTHTVISLQNLVALGRVDLAYGLVDNLQIMALLRENTDILFRASMRPFVLDRRFMALADRLGLVRFWMAGNVWPDFCHDKDLAYDCRLEAQRALRK